MRRECISRRRVGIRVYMLRSKRPSEPSGRLSRLEAIAEKGSQPTDWRDVGWEEMACRCKGAWAASLNVRHAKYDLGARARRWGRCLKAANTDTLYIWREEGRLEYLVRRDEVLDAWEMMDVHRSGWPPSVVRSSKWRTYFCFEVGDREEEEIEVRIAVLRDWLEGDMGLIVGLRIHLENSA